MRFRAASALLLLLCLSGRSIDAGADIIPVSAGSDADAANNDFRRIQDAINAASPGDTIVLSGTFDFTAPFAAASWAFGNDGVPGSGDDYSVYIPGGKNNVTLTAATLGNATIQGPGDLAGVNLEAFLYFDSGTSQDWTISKLRIYDFDLAIGMFASSPTSSTYAIVMPGWRWAAELSPGPYETSTAVTAQSFNVRSGRSCSNTFFDPPAGL